MIEIGEDVKTGKWYYFTEKVKDAVDSLAIGDEITYHFEQIGGGMHVDFLAKGTVEIPEDIKKKIIPAIPTKPTSTYIPQKNKTTDMSKEEWSEKESRDFKGRCIVYASSILKDAGYVVKYEEKEEYLKKLFDFADKLKEYIYKK